MIYHVDARQRRKWGAYLPWQRLNVDQVPLPFVNNMDFTYAEREGRRARGHQPGRRVFEQAAGNWAAVLPPSGTSG